MRAIEVVSKSDLLAALTLAVPHEFPEMRDKDIVHLSIVAACVVKNAKNGNPWLSTVHIFPTRASDKLPKEHHAHTRFRHQTMTEI